MNSNINETALQNNKSKITFRDFNLFCKDNLLIIFITVVLFALLYGSQIFNLKIIFDTEVFLENPANYNYNWLEIGRFGLVLTKHISGLGVFAPYYAGVIFFIGLTIATVTLYYLLHKISGINFKFAYLCIPLLGFSHPIFTLQFSFTLQYAEIALALLFTVLTLLFIYKWLSEKKPIYLIPGIFFMIWSFASYQSLIFLYITLVVFSYILSFEPNSLISKNQNKIKLLLKLAGTFIIGFLFYIIIYKLIFSTSNYLDNNIIWGTQGLFTVLSSIAHDIYSIIFATWDIWNYAYLIAAILAIIIFFIKSRAIIKPLDKFLYLISSITLIISPFLMIFAMGQAIEGRTLFMIPFASSLLFLIFVEYAFRSKRNLSVVVKAIAIILVIYFAEIQMSTTLKLFYTEDYRNQQDLYIAREISEDIIDLYGYDKNHTLVFIGQRNTVLNPVSYSSEVMGLSLLGLHSEVSPYYFWSSIGIVRYLNLIGIEYTKPSFDQVETARTNAQDLTIWPDKGSIKYIDGIVIVKLSEDLYLDE